MTKKYRYEVSPLSSKLDLPLMKYSYPVYVNNEYSSDVVVIKDANGKMLCELHHAKTGVAGQLLQAVNSHDALVKQKEKLRELIYYLADYYKQVDEQRSKAHTYQTGIDFAMNIPVVQSIRGRLSLIKLAKNNSFIKL